MTLSEYRRALDRLLGEFFVGTRPLVQNALNAGFDETALREVLVRLLLPRIRGARREAWTLGEQFILEQAAEQGHGYVTVAALRGYSDRAVERLVDDYMERWSRRDDSIEVLDRRADRLMGTAIRHVQQAVRDEVVDTMEDLDQVETQERQRQAPGSRRAVVDLRDVRYARMLTGADNCGFCVMLASRGPVYTDEEAAWFGSAGNTYHDHCDCVVVPVFDPQDWPGKAQADQLYRLWRDATEGISGGYARAEDGSFTNRPPALAAFDRYLLEERKDGRDPVAEIVGDLREDTPKGNTDDLTAVVDEPSRSDDAEPLDWAARRDALGIDFGADEPKQNEVEFLERFTGQGNTIRWIERDDDDNLPTNDFMWLEQGIEIELKRTKPRYSAIHDHIRRAVVRSARHGVTKENFLVDLGDRPLTDRLRRQLELYNVRNPHRPIARLFVFAAGVLVEIALAVT